MVGQLNVAQDCQSEQDLFKFRPPHCSSCFCQIIGMNGQSKAQRLQSMFDYLYQINLLHFTDNMWKCLATELSKLLYNCTEKP